MNDTVKVIVFDCDGVLFDTAESNRTYYNTIRRHLGLPDMTEAQFAFAHMHTVNETLHHLFGTNGKLKEALAFRNNLDYLTYIAAMKMEPHLIPLLRKLRPHYKTAIATNRTDTMHRVLETHKLESYFNLVICAGDVIHPKPHPEPLLKILNYFHIKPHQALYVGDTRVDQEAAQAAAIPLVAYKNKALSAAYHINSLQELQNILNV
jgi:HAD superfamily hydrolase (TIGR01549 family)